VKACAAGLVALVASVSVAAAEIRVISGNGARGAVTELCGQFERASGHKVSLAFAVNPEAKRRIDAGERFDVAILNPPVLDELISRARIDGTTRTVLGRSGIGVAAREGAPKPDISSVDAFKRTLRSARSVAYPGEGASGKYFVSLVEKLGMAEEMKARLKPMAAEYNVEAVARGEVDLVVAVASRISGVPGVQFVGRIPAELQTWIGFTAGVATSAKEPDAARALLRFFTTPAAASVLRAGNVEPFVE
jgi:molybdate transport system substrate-binding protein